MTERGRDRKWSMQVTALYDYEPEQSDELSFQEGDVLRVLHVQDDGWWSGYNVESPDVVGLFPSNYVQAVRTVPRIQNTTNLVDTGTTPRPPASARQRIQQQTRQESDPPELDDDEEEADEVKELRGHVGAVLQLRKNLEQAERATEAARDARRQAERERLRQRKSWREREQVQDTEEEDMDQQAVEANEDDTEDEEELVFPQLQGDMHETDRQEVEEAEADKSSNIIKNEVQGTENANAESAAASVIARCYRRHVGIIRTNCEHEREVEQQKLSEIAADHIQRWAAQAYSRQRKQKAAQRRLQRENDAATFIQRWIRLRWACFWRKRVQVERTLKEAQQAREIEKLQGEMEEKKCREAENERQLAKEKEERQLLEQKIKEEEEQHRVLQQKLEDEQQQLRQLQLEAVEKEVHRRFIQAQGQEEGNGHHDADPAAPSQAPSVGKTRRKVMKKEAVDLIKTLVQQQLGETLRDHDAKMDELQRMVTRLQTVVRKQTAMLEDSTDQLMNLQLKQQPMPPRSSDAGGGSFLPRITGQSSVPRQPIAPSGLRAPRPVMLSKLPVLASGGRRPSYNQQKLKNISSGRSQPQF
ncbi:hypothetical protein F443_04618 [Phytophthora nicotianae P1569]|uniref:SH3 domain-containing protein n=1 Tax=Phytophthora nicotianae P1569 TaxID=1317065 RepID=V9FL40_PHYNI|nr:hypothetical protein F443_04618 [Phytophthora nicotianae P1569]